MKRENILSLLKEHIVLNKNEIKDLLGIGEETEKEIERLLKEKEIEEVYEDTYVLVEHTMWGDITPTEGEIATAYYINNNEGYFSGATYYNYIGISTLVPCRKEITTNKYNITLNNLNHTDLIKPRKVITKDNKNYLQILDGLCYIRENHVDAPNALDILAEQIKKLKLNKEKLIMTAKEIYPENVLNTLNDILNNI